MLAPVSPVMVGADAASPQPMIPPSASIPTSTLSARATVSPVMISGLSMGRLTAIGSMLRMAMRDLQLLDPGLVDDVGKHRHLAGDAGHVFLTALGTDL